MIQALLFGSTGTRFNDFAASDGTVQMMRPNGNRLARLVVAPSGGTHTSITAAVTAAVALQGADGPHPERRVDVWVKPGTYPGHIALPPWVALYAQPGTVTVTTTNGDGLGTLETSGDCYVEGITFDRSPYSGEGTAPTNPKYPLHHVAARTSVFAGCTFTTSATASGGYPSAMGADVIGGTTTVFYACDFTTTAAGQLATNFHGWSDNTSPLTVIYAKCLSNGTINHNTLNSGQPDQAWFVGNEVGSVRVLGSSAKVHLSGNTLATTPDFGGATTDATSNWPVPVGALSTADRAHYYA